MRDVSGVAVMDNRSRGVNMANVRAECGATRLIHLWKAVVWQVLMSLVVFLALGCGGRATEEGQPGGSSDPGLPSEAGKHGDFVAHSAEQLSSFDWPSDSLTATNSISLDQRTTFLGTVAVTRAATGAVLSHNAELALGIDAVLTGSARADTVFLDARARISGDAAYNGINNASGIGGSRSTPLQVPLSVVIPTLPTTTPGTQNVTVSSNQTSTLQSGTYATVTVAQGNAGQFTKLSLSGGTYTFASLTVGTDAKVECNAACEVRVNGRVAIGARSSLGPASVQGLGPGNVQLLVRGTNGSSGPTAVPAAVQVDNDATLKAFVLAPNGTLAIGQRVVIAGKFVAKDASIGIDSNSRGLQLPVITQQPVSLTVRERQPASFSVVVSGTGNTYQWQRNGVNLAGKTQSSLTFASASVADDQAQFRVVVTNEAGSVTSNAATLTVIPCQLRDDDCDGEDDDCDTVADDDFTPYCVGAGRYRCDQGVLIGRACSDGVRCNGAEVCQEGVCGTGPVEGLDDFNPCTVDGCDESSGISHVPVVSGTSCDDGDDTNGWESCNDTGICVKLPRVSILAPASGEFVSRQFAVEGRITGSGITNVTAGGTALQIDGDRFHGTLEFDSDGKRVIQVVASGPAGPLGVALLEVTVDATPLSLVANASAIPNRKMVGPGGGPNALQQFAFVLNEAIVPSSFQIDANLSARMLAVFAEGFSDLPISEFVTNVSFPDSARRIVVDLNPDLIVSGATYWMTLNTDGLVLANANEVIGTDERSERAVARAEVVPQGTRDPSVVAIVPSNQSARVQPHSKVTVAFSEAMGNVDYALTSSAGAGLAQTRLPLIHRLVQAPDGPFMSILSGRSHMGLLLDTDYTLTISSAGSIDLSGSPLAGASSTTFHTSAVSVDDKYATSVQQFPLTVTGLVAASVTEAVLVGLRDVVREPIGLDVQATRVGSAYNDEGVSVQRWQATVPGPIGEGVTLLVSSGSDTDAVAVLGSPLAGRLPPLQITSTDVQSGTGTESDPFVVVRDNPEFFHSVELGEGDEANPQQLFLDCSDADPHWYGNDDAATAPACRTTATWSWKGVRPIARWQKVGSGEPAMETPFSKPDIAAVGPASVQWHDRSLSLEPGEIYNVQYVVQYFSEDPFDTSHPTRTLQGDPIFVKLSDDVVLQPIFPMIWKVPGSPNNPFAIRSLVQGTSELFDYDGGDAVRESLGQHGSELLRVGEIIETTPDSVGARCYSDYGLCSVQFQILRGKIAQVATSIAPSPCDTSGSFFDFRLNAVNTSAASIFPKGIPPNSSGTFYEFLAPDEALAIANIRSEDGPLFPLFHNYGDFECTGITSGYTGQHYENGVWAVDSDDPLYRLSDTPDTAHEWGHMVSPYHCGDPKYVDPDLVQQRSIDQCRTERLLMSFAPVLEENLLTRDECDKACDLTRAHEAYVQYLHTNRDDGLRCCVQPDGSKKAVALGACDQIGGTPTENSQGFPTGLGVCADPADVASPVPEPEEILVGDGDTLPEVCCSVDGVAAWTTVDQCNGSRVSASLCPPIPPAK